MDWNTYPCDKCEDGINTCKDCISYGDCKHVNQCICCKCIECEEWEMKQKIANSAKEYHK